VFKWVNQNDFWKTIILSPSKLREKFPTVHSKYKLESQASSNPSGQVFDIRSFGGFQQLDDDQDDDQEETA